MALACSKYGKSSAVPLWQQSRMTVRVTPSYADRSVRFRNETAVIYRKVLYEDVVHLLIQDCTRRLEVRREDLSPTSCQMEKGYSVP